MQSGTVWTRQCTPGQAWAVRQWDLSLADSTTTVCSSSSTSHNNSNRNTLNRRFLCRKLGRCLCRKHRPSGGRGAPGPSPCRAISLPKLLRTEISLHNQYTTLSTQMSLHHRTLSGSADFLPRKSRMRALTTPAAVPCQQRAICPAASSVTTVTTRRLSIGRKVRQRSNAMPLHIPKPDQMDGDASP